jgi:hypothetical protein
MSAKPDNTPDRGDLEMAVHAANGLFRVINLIDSGQLNTDDRELKNIRHDLAVAGQMMTQDILNRL